MLDNLPDDVYARLEARADRTGRSVAQEAAELLAELVRHEGDARPSLLELEGLGAELWAGIDATEYIRNERASWD